MWPPYGQGGEELTNQENYDILRGQLDIEVLTTHPRVSPGYTQAEPAADADNKIHRLLDPGRNQDPLYNVRIFEDLCASLRPDVLLIGHPYGFSPALIDALKSSPLLKIFFIGDITCYQTTECGFFPAEYFSGEYCVFVSDFTRESLASGWHSFIQQTRSFLFDSDKCFTLYPATESQSEIADVSHFSVCSLGRFDAIKGFDTLLQAAHRYQFAQHVTIYGDGQFRAQCENYVSCPGWLQSDAKLEALRQHSVFVFASKFHETFGRTWLEAASVGLPLVVSDIEVMQEVIPADHAEFFKRGDPDQLGKAVLKMTDVRVREAYQEKSLALAARYSSQHRRRNLQDIMFQILGKEPARGRSVIDSEGENET
jgi:glycosyltransferase involved in cell wall biosynthesis